MTWQKLCSLGDLVEGRLTKIDHNGVAIMATVIDGVAVAFPPRCPHMAEPLEESGVCDGGVLTCTKHVWQWDLLSGEPQGLAEKPLNLYPAECRGAEVWIDFEHELIYEDD